MRTNLTTEDIRNIIDIAYNGGENDEDIVLVGQNGQESKSIIDYLGLNFFTYKERIEGTSARGYDEANGLPSWITSINTSFGKAYALVEMLDEDVTASQDIDAGVKLGQITFLLQTDKVKNFEYYHNKVKNYYLGNPQTITNAFGETINAYILLGTPVYTEEPITLQIGECVIITCSFKLNYLGNAGTYADYKFSLSIGDEEHFLQMPITNASFGDIFTDNALSTFERPDLTGFVNSSLSQSTTFTFYDFNVDLTNQINELFWSMPAFRIDGELTTRREINLPVFVKVEWKGHTYIYKDVITSIQKQFENNDFVATTMTLKGFGKIIA